MPLGNDIDESLHVPFGDDMAEAATGRLAIEHITLQHGDCFTVLSLDAPVLHLCGSAPIVSHGRNVPWDKEFGQSPDAVQVKLEHQALFRASGRPGALANQDGDGDIELTAVEMKELDIFDVLGSNAGERLFGILERSGFGWISDPAV